jgi:hypothetical protein
MVRLLSGFAFNFNLRRYNVASFGAALEENQTLENLVGRCWLTPSNRR